MVIDPASKSLLLLFFAYLIGSIPFGYLVAHLWAGIDIREHGSQNIGATNVWRTLGPVPGMITFIFDFSKGLLPVTIALWVVPLEQFGNNGFLWATVICLISLAAILGHSFPVWFLFKGGKMVATGLGVMAAIIGGWALIPLLIFGVVLALTRYVSLASIVGAASVPVIFLMGLQPDREIFPKSTPTGNHVFVVFACAAAFFVIVKHRGNIQRLFAGTEPRLGDKKRASGSGTLPSSNGAPAAPIP